MQGRTVKSGEVQGPQPHELPFALGVGPTLNHFRQSHSEGRNIGQISVLDLCDVKLEPKDFLKFSITIYTSAGCGCILWEKKKKKRPKS